MNEFFLCGKMEENTFFLKEFLQSQKIWHNNLARAKAETQDV